MTNTRRASMASSWLGQLQPNGGGPEPFLVRGPGGVVFVIEGGHRRRVSSGLLVAALEQVFGPARGVDAAEYERWAEMAPVEVLEGPKGGPFVIAGGRRLPIRGLPLPHPVDKEEMDRFPEGPELDVAAANVARARFERAVVGRYQWERARGVLSREGMLRGSATLWRRATHRLRRR
ncbi:MAG: hypothetical protein ACRDY6_11120 [Acidimicrobiia bacterium]